MLYIPDEALELIDHRGQKVTFRVGDWVNYSYIRYDGRERATGGPILGFDFGPNSSDFTIVFEPPQGGQAAINPANTLWIIPQPGRGYR